MSLSDHIRYLRALQGGPDILTVATAAGIEKPGSVNLAEKQYRPVHDEELVAKLAAYYGRSLEEFQWHNARPRKYLTFYIARALKTGETITLTLRSGRQLQGLAKWWDLSSVGMQDENGRLLVIQRHAVIDWPGATTEWQDV